MPGPEYAGTVVYYEDFPYAYWNESALDQLGADSLVGLPDGVSIFPTYADVGDQIERKITGITIYESQMERLFDDTKSMAGAVRKYARTHGRARRGRGLRRAVLGDQPRLSRPRLAPGDGPTGWPSARSSPSGSPSGSSCCRRPGCATTSTSSSAGSTTSPPTG